MEKLYEQIRKLTDQWYALIGIDHHKDCDCHFYIETIWSYGDGPRFVSCHYGYIIDQSKFQEDMPREAVYGGGYKEGFLEYEDALVWLRDRLQEMIKEEQDFQRERIGRVQF